MTKEEKYLKEQKKMCKHEQFIKSLGEPQTNREYWIMTEIFVYLHNGADSCNCNLKIKEK